MRENHIPGLAYAVVKEGMIIQQGYEGTANLAWNTLVDRETVFQTASCPKLFCGVLLGRLIDAGLLSPALADFLRFTDQRLTLGYSPISAAFIRTWPKAWPPFTCPAYGCRKSLNRFKAASSSLCR